MFCRTNSVCFLASALIGIAGLIFVAYRDNPNNCWREVSQRTKLNAADSRMLPMPKFNDGMQTMPTIIKKGTEAQDRQREELRPLSVQLSTINSKLETMLLKAQEAKKSHDIEEFESLRMPITALLEEADKITKEISIRMNAHYDE